MYLLASRAPHPPQCQAAEDATLQNLHRSNHSPCKTGGTPLLVQVGSYGSRVWGRVKDTARITIHISGKAQRRSQISRILVLLSPNTVLFPREVTQYHTQLDPNTYTGVQQTACRGMNS